MAEILARDDITPGAPYIPDEVMGTQESLAARLATDGGSGPTRGEAMGAAGAIGGGIGASIAIKSGTVTGAAWVGVGAAGLTGVAASGMVGWEAGTALYKVDLVQQYIQWQMEKVGLLPELWKNPFFPLYLEPAQFPDPMPKLDLEWGNPRKEIWPIPQEGDKLVGDFDAYDVPLDRDIVEIVGSQGWGQWGSSGQGGDAELNRFAEWA